MPNIQTANRAPVVQQPAVVSPQPERRGGQVPAAQQQIPVTNVQQRMPIPRTLGEIRFEDIAYNFVGRRKMQTSGDGCNRCGFNSVWPQITPGPNKPRDAEALREKLGYMYGEQFCATDENGSGGIKKVADVFNQPVVSIPHTGGRVSNVSLTFTIPNDGDTLILTVHPTDDVEKNFAQYLCDMMCLDTATGDVLASRFAQCESLISKTESLVPNARQLSLYEVLIEIIRMRGTIVVTNGGGHFEGAVKN
jgi:hypothetical protein